MKVCKVKGIYISCTDKYGKLVELHYTVGSEVLLIHDPRSTYVESVARTGVITDITRDIYYGLTVCIRFTDGMSKKGYRYNDTVYPYPNKCYLRSDIFAKSVFANKFGIAYCDVPNCGVDPLDKDVIIDNKGKHRCINDRVNITVHEEKYSDVKLTNIYLDTTGSVNRCYVDFTDDKHPSFNMVDDYSYLQYEKKYSLTSEHLDVKEYRYGKLAVIPNIKVY